MESGTVVLYPSPGIGHLVSMVELGKLIHSRHPSLSITVLIFPTTLETGDIDTYITTVSAAIKFHRLAAAVLPPHLASSDFVDLAFAIPELYNPTVHDTLLAISEKSTIKAVILDFFAKAAFPVCKSLDLPTYFFYPSAASMLCVFLYFKTIHKTTSKSIKDLENHLDVPGVPPLHPTDMPVQMVDRESKWYKNFLTTSENMGKCYGIITNSFAGLEERAAGALRDGECIPDAPTPPIYLIGPLIASGSKVDLDEHECLKWLDSQPSKSVVFLCFGSRGVFTKDQLKEIAIGLERSGQRFLWVVRNKEDIDLDLDGFIARTRDKGLVVNNWAPQPAILSHGSVGGFVSHCGWNSALEAVVAGVPMVAWPLYAEQKCNRVFLVEEIKVALALKMSKDEFVTAEAVDETVRELVEGENGRMVKQRVLEMSQRAKAAVENGGSSRVDFFKLIQSWTDLQV